jgi:putative transposase
VPDEMTSPQIIRICNGIDYEIAVFRTRPLANIAMPYVYLDATYLKARNNHRHRWTHRGRRPAVTVDGKREALGC